MREVKNNFFFYIRFLFFSVSCTRSSPRDINSIIITVITFANCWQRLNLYCRIFIIFFIHNFYVDFLLCCLFFLLCRIYFCLEGKLSCSIWTKWYGWGLLTLLWFWGDGADAIDVYIQWLCLLVKRRFRIFLYKNVTISWNTLKTSRFCAT